MINYSERIEENELMDDPNIGYTELSAILNDIRTVNRLLGGNLSVRNSIRSALRKIPGRKIRLLDIGCGDGYTLRYLAKYLEKSGYEASLYGIDLNEKSIRLAKEASSSYPQIAYYCTDALNSKEDIPPCDIVISTLTMHHIEADQLQRFIESCQKYALTTVIINDLERSALAYHLFKVFGAIFMKTSAARKDGLISIRKGFIKSELEDLSRKYELWGHHIYRKWAFRFVWVMNRKRLTKP